MEPIRNVIQPTNRLFIISLKMRQPLTGDRMFTATLAVIKKDDDTHEDDTNRRCDQTDVKETLVTH